MKKSQMVSGMAQTFRIRDEETEMLKDRAMEMIVEKKIRIRESDIIHALIRKHINELKASEVIKYREEFLGKED